MFYYYFCVSIIIYADAGDYWILKEEKMKKGFTLLEMVVVVMIIAVLFILTIPNVSKVINTVDNKTCDALTKVVDSAIVQYKLEYGTMPNSTTDLLNAGFISENQMSCSNGNVIYINDGHACYE